MNGIDPRYSHWLGELNECEERRESERVKEVRNNEHLQKEMNEGL